MSNLTHQLQAFLTDSERLFMHDNGRWFSNHELNRDISAVSDLLHSVKVKPGEQVLIGLPNSYEFIVAYLSLLQYGAVAVPFNSGLTATELCAFLRFNGAVCGFFTRQQWQIIRHMDERLSLTTAFVADGETPAAFAPFVSDNSIWESAPSEKQSGNSFEPAEDDLAILLYTSGTTGKPKGVGLKHSQVFASCQNVIQAQALSPEDVAYCFLPLFHINAQVIVLLSTCLSGGRIVMAPKFSAGRFWPTVRDYKVTWVSAVPAVIGILLNSAAPTSIPERLRFVRSASAPLPLLQEKRFEQKFHIPIIQSYGMSEAAGQICINPLPPGERRLGSVGLPVGVELRIVDSDGVPLAPCHSGEIILRGKNVIERYAEAENQNDFDGSGWFHTGDIGYQDETGYVYITGRSKEMINRAGEKISPLEVENVIREHPRVQQVAVIGLPDPVYGEQVAAYVVITAVPNKSKLREKIMEHCKTTLSSHKIPAKLFFVSEIPVGATGKVQRVKLKQQVTNYAIN